MLINMKWRMRFPQAVVYHCPYFKLDHHAILMQMNHIVRPNRYRCPFRFVAAWLTHGDFPNLMERSLGDTSSQIPKKCEKME